MISKRRILRAVEALLYTASASILALIGWRAAIRLELRWDAWWYHIPFAARRGGVKIPFEMSEIPAAYYQGFPPLPHFVMGLLWRVTGDIRAAGLANFLALLAFLVLCQRLFRAPVFVTVFVALTSPMVLIHSATTYVDLFGNCWVAIALLVLARAYLFDDDESPRTVIIGLACLVAAAWSKMQLVAIVFPTLVVYLAFFKPWRDSWGTRRSLLLQAFVGATLLAAAPFLKNLALYGNPLWPADFPVVPEFFARGVPELRTLMARQRPPDLHQASQLELFARSLFEIGHPTAYPSRHRWIIDQGNAGIAFRSGGLWNIAVVAYLLLLSVMLLRLRGRRGAWLMLAFVIMLLFVGILPQSHELRYFLFIPLVWAGLIAMLYPLARERGEVWALSIIALVLGLFTSSARLTVTYYRPDPINYTAAAHAWGADIMWKYLRPGFTFCAVGNEPRAFFLTGPTMREYRIVSRAEERNCPAGSIPVVGTMVYYDRPATPRIR